MRRSLAGNKKLLHFFDTLMKICEDGLTPTDSEVASRLGYTRATASNHHEKLLQHLCDCGLYEECRMALAA